MKPLYGTALKRFIRDWRREHPPLGDLALVLQSVSYPMNVGSLFRIADAVGVEKMILCGATPTPPNPTIIKVGRDKHKNVAWSYIDRPEDAVLGLRHEGYKIIALELAESALPYYEITAAEKTAIVVGNEDHGVSRSVLDLCDSAVFIPMLGKGQSMNVHVSAAVLLFHLRNSIHTTT
jgi:tRNA (guanosine-2'-O-)-methyltransferase